MLCFAAAQPRRGDLRGREEGVVPLAFTRRSWPEGLSGVYNVEDQGSG